MAYLPADPVGRLAHIKRIRTKVRNEVEKATRVVWAGCLRWSCAPIPSCDGFWRIVESARTTDQRLLGFAACAARLERLERERALPERTDGQVPVYGGKS